MKNIIILIIIINAVIFSCKGPTPEPDSTPIKEPNGALVIKFTDLYYIFILQNEL